MLSMMQQASAIRLAKPRLPLPAKLSARQIDERVLAAVTEAPGSTVSELYEVIGHQIITEISICDSLRRLRGDVVQSQATRQSKARIWPVSMRSEAEANTRSGDNHWQRAYRSMNSDMVYSTAEVSEMVGMSNEMGLRTMRRMQGRGLVELVLKRTRGGCFWRKVSQQPGGD